MESFKIRRFERNPQEKEIVDQFVKNHPDTLQCSLIVFGHKPDSCTPEDYLNEREHRIVVSTIQWLASPVGEAFLNKCGFFKKEEAYD